MEQTQNPEQAILGAAGAAPEGAASGATQEQPKPTEKTVKARLLVDCQHGKANDVIDLPAPAIKALCEQGFADSNKPAVAYALGLKKQDAE